MDAEPTEEEQRRPFLWRYMVEIPEEGKFKFFDTCWMEEVTEGRIGGTLTDDEYDRRIDSINTTERQLVDNGYLVMKFFFHIGKKEQRARLDSLAANRSVSDDDGLHWEGACPASAAMAPATRWGTPCHQANPL